MASITANHNIYTFEVFCAKCHKIRDVQMDGSIVGDKDLSFIECNCGHSIPVEALKYLFRNKGYINERLKYFVT